VVLEPARVLASKTRIGQQAGHRAEGSFQRQRQHRTGRSDMQLPQFPSPRTPPGVASQDKHRSRWKLGQFTWPIWHGSSTADKLVPGTSSPINSSLHGSTRQGASLDGESPLPEFFAAALLQECELHDAVLLEARRRLEALEVDPETDEFTLVIARHEVFRRKRSIARTFTS